MTTRINGRPTPLRRQRVGQFTPLLEVRADRLIMSYKRPLFAGTYNARTGNGEAYCGTSRRGSGCWWREIKRGQWSGPRRIVNLDD